MAHFYPVPASDTPVTLAVHVSTPAEATTIVRIVEPDSSWKYVTSSDDADGIIPPEEIGSGKALSGRVLKIRSFFELELIKEENRQAVIDNMLVEYTFTGGVAGTRTFAYETADKRAGKDKLTVVIVSTVHLNFPL